jgi:hypothetical protein
MIRALILPPLRVIDSCFSLYAPTAKAALSIDYHACRPAAGLSSDFRYLSDLSKFENRQVVARRVYFSPGFD